jgi:hypothetical protein
MEIARLVGLADMVGSFAGMAGKLVDKVERIAEFVDMVYSYWEAVCLLLARSSWDDRGRLEEEQELDLEKVLGTLVVLVVPSQLKRHVPCLQDRCLCHQELPCCPYSSRVSWGRVVLHEDPTSLSLRDSMVECRKQKMDGLR